ncbi:MAG: tRNA lysidine(34) synthetase TilS [Rectinema sp.]
MKSLETVVKEVLFSLGVDREQHVILAFSGGLDSTVLLDVLVNILGNERLRAVYVCHNLRPKQELEREMSLIKDTCRIKKVRLTLVHIREGAISKYAKQKKCGIEAAARRFRYYALIRTARRWGISTIVTAHHADDQVETILMRLMRGGSLSSLAGISTSTALDRGSKIRVLRPLLQVERRTLRDYAEKQGLHWSEDSTNDKTIFLRNKVRHMLVPYLDEQFSSWKHAILGYASQIGDAEAALRNIAEQRLSAMQRVCRGEPALDLDLFKEEPVAVRRKILRFFLRGLGIGHHFGHYALQSLDTAIISGALKTEAARYEFDLSEGLLRCKGKTQFSSAPRARNASFLLDSYKEDQYFLKVQAPGEYACGDFRFIAARRGQGGNVISEHDGIELSLAFPFIVRNRKEGDRLHTKEGIRKIDALLKEAKVPVNVRHTVPVIEDMHGIAAVFLPVGADGQAPGVLYRKPLLCEDGEIVYIFLLMKGDHTINV